MMFSGQDTLPRTHRDVLADAARLLIDLCMRDVVDLWHGRPPQHVLADATLLPPRYAARYDVAFARRFLMALLTVEWKLTDEDVHSSGSVAEELALNGIIGHAEALLATAGVEDPDDHLHVFAGTAFEDRDFEWLWAEETEGIEASAAAVFCGIGNLAFEDWFEPFRPVSYLV